MASLILAAPVGAQASTDSVLAAELEKIRPGATILDIGRAALDTPDGAPLYHVRFLMPGQRVCICGAVISEGDDGRWIDDSIGGRLHYVGTLDQGRHEPKGGS
jgi:hypothetical protein